MTNPRPFGPVERVNVSDRVRDDIQSRIVSGEFQPGSAIPAERVLAEQFEVARTSVREATKGLIALGIIERRGNRTIVVEQLSGPGPVESDGDTKRIRALLEARNELEIALFSLAAVRATARERNATLALGRQPIPSTIEEFTLIDRQFHSSIAAACGNPVLSETYGRVLDAIIHAEVSAELVLGVPHGVDAQPAMLAAANEHWAIAKAYAARDVATMLFQAQAHLGSAGARAYLRQQPTRLRQHDSPRTVGL